MYENPDIGSELFTIKFHHGGEFIFRSKRIYVAGKGDYFDACEAEKMSMPEMDYIAKKLGRR